MELDLIISKGLYIAIIFLSFFSMIVLGMVILSLSILYKEKKPEHFWHVIAWLLIFYLLQGLRFIGENLYGTEI